MINIESLLNSLPNLAAYEVSKITICIELKGSQIEPQQAVDEPAEETDESLPERKLSTAEREIAVRRFLADKQEHSKQELMQKLPGCYINSTLRKLKEDGVVVSRRKGRWQLV
jgi:hypothetical protein